jgi:hypothetical protein
MVVHFVDAGLGKGHYGRAERPVKPANPGSNGWFYSVDGSIAGVHNVDNRRDK